MALTINTNIASLNAQRNLAGTQNVVQTALQRLSSGLRVNSAKDDAAGIAIASKFDAQARGLAQAVRNANDGISMVQTADGALATMSDILQRMRELAVQSVNTTNDSDAIANLNAEMTALDTEFARIATSTKFNGLAVVGGDAGDFNFQVGANEDDIITVTTTDQSTSPGVTLAADDGSTITSIDDAITSLNTDRATYGAALNQLGFAVSNLQIGVENQKSAYGRIMDADFAVETANLTRGQVLQQAGTSMLAQANSAPQGVLALLKNF